MTCHAKKKRGSVCICYQVLIGCMGFGVWGQGLGLGGSTLVRVLQQRQSTLPHSLRVKHWLQVLGRKNIVSHMVPGEDVLSTSATIDASK